MGVVLSADLKYIFYNSTPYLGHGIYSKIPFYFAASVIFLYIHRWKYYMLNVDLSTQLETTDTIRTNL